MYKMGVAGLLKTGVNNLKVASITGSKMRGSGWGKRIRAWRPCGTLLREDEF